MKSNKGITLTSLVIYIIGLTIVISLMSVFIDYFYQNVNEITLEQNANEQYSRLLSYVTKDVNSDNIKLVQANRNSTDSLVFKFNDNIEHQYIYQNGKIYYLNIENGNEKKLLLCKKITPEGNVFNYENGKIDINFSIQDELFSVSFSVNS